MRHTKPVDVPRLFALWADLSLTRVEVAHGLGVSETQLTRLIHRYRLPRRAHNYNNRPAEEIPPDEEEASRSSLAIAPGLRAACEEVKRKHFAERRAEPEDLTRSKIWKWDTGICRPREGRHA